MTDIEDLSGNTSISSVTYYHYPPVYSSTILVDRQFRLTRMHISRSLVLPT